MHRVNAGLCKSSVDGVHDFPQSFREPRINLAFDVLKLWRQRKRHQFTCLYLLIACERRRTVNLDIVNQLPIAFVPI